MFQEDLAMDSQIMLILVGLVGSGKSTFAEALEKHFPTFRRCNQDSLGSRKKVEIFATEALHQGYSVCVDRTNFDERWAILSNDVDSTIGPILKYDSQRAHFIRIARPFPDTQVWGLVFDTPYETCADRLQNRTGHPTITSPEQGLQVLERFSNDYRPPILEEGFNRIYHISPHPTGEYTTEDIIAILRGISISPLCQDNVQPKRDSLRFFRGTRADSQFDTRYRSFIGNA